MEKGIVGGITVSTVGTLLGYAIIETARAVDVSTTSFLVLTPLWGLWLVSSGWALYLLWRYRPSQRLKRQFREFVPEMERALQDIAGTLDSRLAREASGLPQGLIGPAWARVQIVLVRLSRQFGIAITVDPFDLVKQPEHYSHFVEVLAKAQMGDLQGAKGLRHI